MENESVLVFPLCSASCGTQTELRHLSTAGPENQTEDIGRHEETEGRVKYITVTRGGPLFFLLLGYEACRSVCSESWCHVKLTALCVNMTLPYIPVLHPPFLNLLPSLFICTGRCQLLLFWVNQFKGSQKKNNKKDFDTDVSTSSFTWPNGTDTNPPPHPTARKNPTMTIYSRAISVLKSFKLCYWNKEDAQYETHGWSIRFDQ